MKLTDAQRENEMYKICGFYTGITIVRVLEKMLKTKPEDNTSKWLKQNLPFEYIRYMSYLKGELKIGDIVLTIRGGFSSLSGGRVLKVYKITENCIYLCTLGCEQPELETDENIGKRFCIYKNEVFSSVININGVKFKTK